MDKSLVYKSRNNETIKGENIGEILIHINPQTSAPAVADISDLNKILVGLFLKRKGKEEITIHDGTLLDILKHLYEGSPMLDVVKTKLSNGYNFLLDFSKTPFILNDGDEFRISITAGNANEAFTNAVTASTTLNLYTNPSNQGNAYGLLPIFKNHFVGNNENLFDKSLGNNIGRIVIDVHPTDTYSATANAKPDTIQLDCDSFNENTTSQELLARNQRMLSVNPDTSVKALVHYQGSPLPNVKYRVKFDAQCTKDHKILTTQFFQL